MLLPGSIGSEDMSEAPDHVSKAVWDDAYYQGMEAALRIVRRSQPSPQTRCPERAFKAAQTRIAAQLRKEIRTR